MRKLKSFAVDKRIETRQTEISEAEIMEWGGGNRFNLVIDFMSNILTILTILAIEKTNAELMRQVGIEEFFKRKCPGDYEVIKDKMMGLYRRMMSNGGISPKDPDEEGEAGEGAK